MFKRLFLLLIALIFYASSAVGADVSLMWSTNTESDLAGYRVFSREEGQSYNYTAPSWEGTDITCTIYDLSDTEKTFFVVRAFDTEGNESGNSNEVNYKREVQVFEMPDEYNVNFPDAITYDGVVLIGTTDKTIHIEWETPVGGADNYNFRLYDINKKTYVFNGYTHQNSLDIQLPLSGLYYIEIQGVRAINLTEWKRINKIISGWPSSVGPIIID